MRYNIGQLVPIIRFHYTSELGFSLNSVLVPRLDTLHCIVVKEHHKVPWSYNPEEEQKYDGYILESKDQSDEIWTNQYPVAHYGQTSTEADYMFMRRPVEPEKASEEDLAIFKDGLHELSNINHGIRKLRSENESCALSLQAFFDQVYKAIETATGKKIKASFIFDKPENKGKTPEVGIDLLKFELVDQT